MNMDPNSLFVAHDTFCIRPIPECHIVLVLRDIVDHCSGVVPLKATDVSKCGNDALSVRITYMRTVGTSTRTACLDAIRTAFPAAEFGHATDPIEESTSWTTCTELPPSHTAAPEVTEETSLWSRLKIFDADETLLPLEPAPPRARKHPRTPRTDS
jgi:hypothetical protein